MSSRMPIVRQTSWIATIPQFITLTSAIAIGYFLKGTDGLLWGAGGYLAYSFGSRSLLLKSHNTGMTCLRQKLFEEAIDQFQKSFDFLDRHAWIDRYRSVVMMSPSALGYREMALNNIAFCLIQLGDADQARAYYELCRERFPDSDMAETALRFMETASKSEPPETAPSEL